MNPISQILWEAAADVERRGVTRPPYGWETCAVIAVADAANRSLRVLGPNIPRRFLRTAIASGNIADWNDRQPSRAVVAAAMRDAAFLASWAGPHLLGGSK